MKRTSNLQITSVDPSDRVISKSQAKRLASLAGIDPASISGTVREVSEKLKWIIDPELFLFRKVCGKVVKKDAVTGEEYPVPFATVYVEDTDCNLISYFPQNWPWVWHFPFNCRREVIAQTKTDKCGNFCVWVPRFDIDWVLRWRKERICFPWIFRRPDLQDLLPDVLRVPELQRPPIPGPDPAPFRTLTQLPQATAEALLGQSADRLIKQLRSQSVASLGMRDNLADQQGYARAFNTELPPPLPAEFQAVLTGQNRVAEKDASAEDAIRAAVAEKVGVSPKVLADFNPQRFIGPFLRCVDVFMPNWQMILDAPDISFRVGQDVDGDGVEETIYSEGYFDVRWDAGNLPNVTLVANDQAKESSVCDAPTIPCGNVPAILFAGFMPLTLPAYYDNATGYAVRPNRPKFVTSGGDILRPAAQTPFCGTVQLHGCVDVSGAHYYRLLRSVDGAVPAAITGVAWNNYKNSGGAPIVIHADNSGWYPVHPLDSGGTAVDRADLAFPNLLMSWPTPLKGKQVLTLEIADAGKVPIAQSAAVALQTDNTAPEIHFSQLSWKFVGEPDSALRNLLGVPCPTIRRGVVPQPIELVFSVQVSALHLRDASLGTGGCGGGAFAPIDDPLNKSSHWHSTVMDNTVLLYQRYRLEATALQGAYSFSCTAASRAMNPSGADGGNNVPPDWFYDPIYIYRIPSLGLAVVNVD